MPNFLRKNPTFLNMIRIIGALGIWFCIAHGTAFAACTSEMRAHVNLGLDFLKEARAYDRRDETDLASAEWENMGHQVELLYDDMLSCDNDKALRRDFYLLASWDSYRRFQADVINGLSDAVLHSGAIALRSHVGAFYYFGGAEYYKAEYVTLKSIVKNVYKISGLTYCSPESDDRKCDALAAEDEKRAVASEVPTPTPAPDFTLDTPEPPPEP
jgi:hypothetical protein